MKGFPLLSFFGYAKELAYMQSYIKICDNTSAIVENCRQINECTEICVRLTTRSFGIEIWGRELTLSCCNEDSVEIRGKIEQVKLISRKMRERDE